MWFILEVWQYIPQNTEQYTNKSSNMNVYCSYSSYTLYILKYLISFCCLHQFLWSECPQPSSLMQNYFETCIKQPLNWPNLQIPECTCSISQNAPFRTEMCTFLFWMEHCGFGTGEFWDLWNWPVEYSLKINSLPWLRTNMILQWLSEGNGHIYVLLVGLSRPPINKFYCSIKLSFCLSLFSAVNMLVHLNDMQPGETIDEWHNLTPINLTTKGNFGSLRVRAKYLHEVIMPLKEYSSLKEVRTIDAA